MDVNDSALVIELCGKNDREHRERVELIWRDISYVIEQKKWTWSLHPIRRSQKQILHEMSGLIESGTLTAVIGPSGAGNCVLCNT